MTAHQRMVASLVKPGATIKEQLTADDCHLLHMSIGLCGESLELVQAIINNDNENIMEECGDALFYLTALFQIFEVPLNFEPCNEYRPTLFAINCGDILDQVKKQAIYRKPLDVTNILHLLLKARDYIVGICKFNSITIEQCLEHNYDKLMKKRYPNGKYSDADAQARADKQ